MSSSDEVVVERIVKFLESDDSALKGSKVQTRESIKTLRYNIFY